MRGVVAMRRIQPLPPTREAALDRRYSELYVRYFEDVWRWVRCLGEPPSSLDDAVQDVFLVAYRRFRDFEGRSSPRTWLFAITTRVVSDHRRSRRRRSRLLGRMKGMFDGPMRTSVEPIATVERSRALVTALSGLSEERRAVFMMADLEEMSAPEIASALNVNLNTVYSRLRRARDEIAELLAGASALVP